MEYGSNFRVVFRGGEVKMSWQKVNYWNWSAITYFMVMTIFSCRLRGICPIAGHLWCMKWNRMEFCHTEPLKRCLLHELWHSIMRIGQPAKESSTIKTHLPVWFQSVFVSITRVHYSFTPIRTLPPNESETGRIRRKWAFIRKSYIMFDEKTTGQLNEWRVLWKDSFLSPHNKVSPSGCARSRDF